MRDLTVALGVLLVAFWRNRDTFRDVLADPSRLARACD